MTEKQNITAGDSNLSTGLNERIYRHILNQIIELELKPGQRINTAKIADELEVSRTPIRSAMDRLSEEGFVECLSNRGYRVSPIIMVDYFNLCDTRKMLEGGVAYMAASHIGAADLKILEKSIADAKECVNSKNYDGFAGCDFVFHDTIFRAANNKYLKAMYDIMEVKMTRYRHIISYYCRDTAEQDTRHAIEKHSCIYRALKNRYASVAQNEMEEHIAYTYRTLLNLGWIISSQSGRENE